MISDFLNGKFNVEICSGDWLILDEFIKRMGNLKWGSGLDFNGHYIYELIKRGDPFWLGVEEDGRVYVSHSLPWKGLHYPLSEVLNYEDKFAFNVSEEEIISLMGD